MILRWEEQSQGGWYGYSGEFIAAVVVQISAGPLAGKWAWNISIPTKWLGPTSGERVQCDAAKRAAALMWRRFLDHAQLVSSEVRDV
jgi:hypothetical protein